MYIHKNEIKVQITIYLNELEVVVLGPLTPKFYKAT